MSYVRYDCTYIRFLAIVILCFCLGYGSGYMQAQKRVLNGLSPQSDPSYAQGVSGHIAWVDGDLLLMAGGCNFPDTPARAGGAKRYYRDVYVANLVEGLNQAQGDHIALNWERVGALPHPTAYAAFVPYLDLKGKKCVIVAGGKSDQGDLTDVYTMWLSPMGELRMTTLPSLPAPRSGMASVLWDNRLYLIGGAVNGKLSNSVISLNLNNLSSGWQLETPYPHSPFLKVVASKESTNIVCVGSFSGVEEDGQAVKADVTYMVYSPDTKTWAEYSSENDSVLGDVSFGGGYALGYSGAFSGGVRSDIFVAALQRDKDLKRANSEGDKRLIKKLQKESRTYLSHQPKWYRFNGDCYSWDSEKKCWTLRDNDSFPGRADAVFLTHQLGAKTSLHLLIGGEIMPGVRTPSIYMVSDKLEINLVLSE